MESILVLSAISVTEVTKIARVHTSLLLDFSLTVKAATLIFISRCGSAISSAKEGKFGVRCLTRAFCNVLWRFAMQRYVTIKRFVSLQN